MQVKIDNMIVYCFTVQYNITGLIKIVVYQKSTSIYL